MRKGDLMYKKIISFLIFCIVFSFLLVGCSSAIYSSGCVSINYNGSKYNYLSEWEMLSDNYIVKSIEQDGVNLSIRSYDDDTRDEFLFCEDNGSLYHNESYILPENKVENIDHLLFSFHGSNDELNILDSDTIYEFTKIFLMKVKAT